ncbi:MAG: anaerobic sulfatase maturase [Candidatus Lokiarchaeota archaeon]|nr:anaerobic sulfatase maturase [Candidatus Lokiarchaeota archaeon]MBD3339227.1 anaerobic sulfatase maturase [Candidatus Lokiarchaeota archaeon]
MQQFQLLIKPVSYRCNLRCKYCFYLRVEDIYPKIDPFRMSDEVLESMISQLLKYRFRESIFGWQGGEPTLAGLDFFKKVVSFQQKYGQSGQIVGNAIQTNGTLLAKNEEWAKFLEKYKFLIGLSLDGPKHIHDRYRKDIKGGSVWEKVMQAAQTFRDYGVEFNILCVVSKANVSKAEEIYKFFLENGFYHLQFIPALEADQNGKRASFSVSANQLGKFYCNLFNIWRKNPDKASIRLFNGMIAHHLGYPKGNCAYEKKCADYMLVEWNGDVYPCDFFVQDKYKLGNLLKQDLSELKQKRDNSFAQIKLKLSPICQKCKWLELCYGGCVKDRFFQDNPHADRSYYCEAYRALFKESNQWFIKYSKNISY